jgi:6-phosphogluconolactonase/glucosamine-6-phosphate isomerase/deaminase
LASALHRQQWNTGPTTGLAPLTQYSFLEDCLSPRGVTEPSGDSQALNHNPTLEIDRSAIGLSGWLTRTSAGALFDVYDEAQQMGIAKAHEIAEIIRANNAVGKITTLITPTGSTPIPVYNELARLHREEGLSFEHVHTFNMDEYYVGPEYEGDWSKHSQSYRQFMEEHLFSKVNIPINHIHFLNGQAVDPVAEAERYEREFKQFAPQGVHLGFGGVGSKGHIAFNEAVIIIDEAFFDAPESVQREKLGSFNEFVLTAKVGQEREVLLRILKGHSNFRSDRRFPSWLDEKIRSADPDAGPKSGLSGLVNKLLRQPVKVYFDKTDTRYPLVQQLVQELGSEFEFPIELADANEISRSRTHLVHLALSTVIDNSRFFSDLLEIPIRALTIGLGTFMDSQQIRILASGENKILPLHETAENPVSVENPVAIVRTHLSHAFVVNRHAAPPKVRMRWEFARVLEKFYDRVTGHIHSFSAEAPRERLTTQGHFKPTPLPLIERTFDRLSVEGKTVFALGSGTGIELVAAVVYGAARVVGVESDEDLVEENIEVLRSLGHEERWRDATSRISLHAADFLSPQVSLKKADLICYTDCGSFAEQHLEDKLLAEMKPGARLVAFQAPLKRIVPLFHRLQRMSIEGLPDGVEVYERPPK